MPVAAVAAFAAVEAVFIIVAGAIYCYYRRKKARAEAQHQAETRGAPDFAESSSRAELAQTSVL